MAQTRIKSLTDGVASAEQVHHTRLTVAQIRALNATPRVIIPAPGAGKIIVPGRGVVVALPAGTVFAGGSAVSIRYTGTTVEPYADIPTDLFTANTLGRRVLPGVATAFTPAVNAAVQLATSGAFTGGRGVLDIWAYYHVIEV